MSIKLTDAQIILLSAASQRDDRCLARPQSMKDAEVRKIGAKLDAAGLAKEIKAKPGAPVWRRDEEAGQDYALKLTAAGAKAIVVEESEAPDANSEPEEVSSAGKVAGTAAPEATPGQPAPRAGTKLATVVGLLERDAGATLSELIAATDWLPHTTRAALTGLRKRGYSVTLDRSDKVRGSNYRLGSDRTVAAVATTTTTDDLTEATAPMARTKEPPQVSHATKATRMAGARARKAA